MADRYVDRAYIEATLGANYLANCLAETGRDLDVLIEQSTALVRSAMRNSGINAPVSSDGTGVEEIVRFAVVGQLIEILVTAPGSSIPLPEDWDESPYKTAYKQVIDGDIQTDAAPDSLGAVGGFGISTSAAPRRTTRSDMDMW